MLVGGFCHTEGLLAGAPVTGVRYCATGGAVETEFNVVTVDTGGRAPTPTPRLGTTSSSCGWCGSEQLEQMCDRLPPLPDVIVVAHFGVILTQYQRAAALTPYEALAQTIANLSVTCLTFSPPNVLSINHIP